MAELAEGARLEIVCTSKAYRGFESLSLRHFSVWIDSRILNDEQPVNPARSGRKQR